MVNGVPREVPRPKPEGPQAPSPSESIGHYSGLGQGILLELNPNILVRDEERIYTVYPLPASLLPSLLHPHRMSVGQSSRSLQFFILVYLDSNTALAGKQVFF